MYQKTAAIRVFTVLFILTAASPAFGSERLAILDITFDWTWTEGVEASFKDAFEAGLRQDPTTFEVISLGEVSTTLANVAPEVVGCTEPECLMLMGEALEASIGASAQVKSDGDSYEFAITFYWLENGQILHAEETACDFCTLEEAERSFLKLASGALEALKPLIPRREVVDGECVEGDTRPECQTGQTDPIVEPKTKVMLTIQVDPADAHIFVGDVEVGVGQATVELGVGEHRVVTRVDGYKDLEQTVIVNENTKGPIILAVHMRPIAGRAMISDCEDGLIDRADRSLYGWIFLGSGVVILATGAALLALDGEPTCDGPITACEEIYETSVSGYIFTVLGAAAVTASVVFFLWEELAGPPPVKQVSTGVQWGVGVCGDSIGVSFGGSF